MRRVFIILFLFYLHSGCLNLRKAVKEYGSHNIHSEARNSGDIIICEVPIEARYNREEWTTYLNKNLMLDDASLDTIPPGTFTVLVQFLIDTKGKVGDVKILKDPGYGLGQRTANTVSRYECNWKPAEQNGRFINSYRVQPITFRIEEEKTECANKLMGKLIL